MKKVLSVLTALVFLFSSCAPYKNTARLAPVQNLETTDNLIYSYSADVVRISENNIKKGWANRKNVQVLNVEIINTSDKAIHGSQLGFYSEGKKLELVNNKLAAEKLKTKKFPAIVYIIPIVLVGAIIYAAISPPTDLDGDGFSDIDSESSKKEKKDPMENANLVQQGLYNFNAASVILRPGEKVSGLIPFHSKKAIEKLEIRVNNVDFDVVK